MRLFPKRLTLLFFMIGFILSIFIILPYFHKGYFPTHDGEWAVVRAGEMFREIRDHQFPPRYSGVLNFGFGYPLFNFAYPAPYYLATTLHIFHIGFTASVKTIFAGSVILSFIGMFLLSSKFWKNSWAGFISGIFYILLPYYLVDLYVRGSIGEALSFSLYPFLILSCLFILEKKHIQIALFSLTLLVAVLITTHNISAVYFGIIFGAYVIALFASRKNKEAFITLGGFIWGALISAFFLAPALLEKKNIKLSKIPIADRSLYYVNFQKLLFSPFGYGTPTDAKPFTYQLGIPQIFGFIMSLLSLKIIRSEKRAIIISFTILSIFFIFMMFPISFFIWKLPLLSEINYPWTLLLPLGFIISFLSGGMSGKKSLKIISIVLISAAVVLYLPYAKPQSYINKGDAYYLTNPATTTSSNELMPLWVAMEPEAVPLEKVQTQSGVENLIYSSNKITFISEVSKPETVTINQIYYPGWVAYDNDREMPLRFNNKRGVMQVYLIPGKHFVSLQFKETKERMFLDAFSLLSLLTLLGFGVKIVFSKLYGKTKKRK